MTVPFRRAAAAARAVGGEAAALAGHLLRYPAGLAQEQWALLQPPCPPHHASVPPPASAPEAMPTPATASAHTTAAAHPATAAHTPTACAPGPGPVLLLHGFVDNRSVFSVLRRDLLRHGWQHVHALNYSPFTQDVRAAAVLLGRHVEQARRIHGDQRIAVVGHSLGGLIGRYYVQRLGGDEHVHALVTLGTPHRGTLAARLPGLPPITRQLRPESDLFRELEEAAPDCRTRFAAFWSDLDQLILPARFARLDHPDLKAENILVPDVGHLTLTVHGAVLTGVRRFLLQQPTCEDRPVRQGLQPPGRLTA
ncbi:lipase family alpha/beta hydrolase [Streptacidiphilus griseoplanus]|uniref:lipase family alpha/beta hydrolase n=1 Tax=Peterkaempfera griseoplana TaxID=66896 RepID=UPI0007C74804|nr:alpha/beta fold hydrolase [Peterkaempfera griseoplana]